MKRARTAIALSAAALMVGAGAAVAATALDPAEPLQACVNNTNGGMRLTAYGDECKPGESPVTWNAQGPQGLPGEDATLSSGTAYGVVVHEGSLNPRVPRTGSYPTGLGYGDAVCPDGKRVLSAHAWINYGNYYTGELVPLGTEIHNADPTKVLVQWKQYLGTNFTSGIVGYELTCAHLTP